MEYKRDGKIVIKSQESQIQIKKSRFLCTLKTVRSEREAREFIDSIKRVHYDARHSPFAMRIGIKGGVLERSADDGEPSGTAGRPMLKILKEEKIYDICAVVTRFFGGILLGTGGLMRAYSESLKKAITLAETADMEIGMAFKLSLSYAEAQKIRNILSSSRAILVDVNYAGCCTINIIVAEDMYLQFLAKLNEYTKGKSHVIQLKKVLYYMASKPVIYEEIS